MPTFDELIRQRLTRQQYIGIVGQEYHLSSNAPLNLRLAADHISNPKLADWLRHHAADEDGHHLWAADDLKDLGAPIPAQTPATQRLLTRVREIASGPDAHRILGLSYVVEHSAPKIDPAQLLPDGLGQATRFIVRHTKVDVKHAREVDEIIASLPPAQQAEIREQAAEFGRLFTEFLVSAANTPPETLSTSNRAVA